MDEKIIAENKRLVEEYPFLMPRNRFTDEIPDDYDYTYTELDDMPDGWRKAFGEQMCAEIKEALGPDIYDYRIIQIKEKYGQLRWYDRNSDDKIYKIIDKYSRLSEHTCVSCGAPATKISLGWICPWCDACASKMYGKFMPLNPNKDILDNI